jgi:hypothetical protein
MQIIIIFLTLYFEVLVLGLYIYIYIYTRKFTWIRKKGRKTYKLIHINTKYPKDILDFI